MHEWQVWIVAALVLFGAEMLAPGFWLVSVALGCLAAGVVSAILPGLLAPSLTFAATTVASLVGIRPFLLRHMHRGTDVVRTNVDALIGKIGVVTERIDPATKRGRVLVEGEDWRGATLPDGSRETRTPGYVVRGDRAPLVLRQQILCPRAPVA